MQVGLSSSIRIQFFKPLYTIDFPNHRTHTGVFLLLDYIFYSVQNIVIQNTFKNSEKIIKFTSKTHFFSH